MLVSGPVPSAATLSANFVVLRRPWQSSSVQHLMMNDLAQPLLMTMAEHVVAKTTSDLLQHRKSIVVVVPHMLQHIRAQNEIARMVIAADVMPGTIFVRV